MTSAVHTNDYFEKERRGQSSDPILPFLHESGLARYHRSVDLISDALPFGRQWYEQTSDANRKSDGAVTISPIKIVVTRRESAILK